MKDKTKKDLEYFVDAFLISLTGVIATLLTIIINHYFLSVDFYYSSFSLLLIMILTLFSGIILGKLSMLNKIPNKSKQKKKSVSGRKVK